MKKTISLLTFCIMIFSLTIPAFAAETNSYPKNNSFEISLEEVLEKADSSDIKTFNGVTTIPLTVDVNSEVYTEIIITVTSLNRASAKSFSMEGWFRLKSNQEIVTAYGLDGTFEYNGTNAESKGASSYHNSTLKGWTGDSRTSESENDDGSASITGKYTCYQNGNVNNTASCTAKSTKNGGISFSGNYDESTIF